MLLLLLPITLFSLSLLLQVLTIQMVGVRAAAAPLHPYDCCASSVVRCY
jgi:hypothetical protein